MGNKPLSKEAREAIIEYCDIRLPINWRAMFDSILSDAAYWREVVKNIRHDELPDFCIFCEVYVNSPHMPDCPWLLANQE